MSTLDGKALATLACTIPPSGAWWATVLLEPGVAAPVLGGATLTIADLSLVGAVVSAEEEAPTQYRVELRGGPGWWLPLVRAESWQSAGGVKLKTILVALQKATGETLTMPTDRGIGAAFGWPAAGPYAPSTGALALDALVRRAALPTWRVEPGGGTVFTAWPSIGAAGIRARALRRSTVTGRRSLGLDVAAAMLLPGATVEGVVVRRVAFREVAGSLGAEVYSS